MTPGTANLHKQPRFERVFTIVLDSVGIGELPDAALYNDRGAHTLGHIADYVGGLSLPHLERMGLGSIGEQIRGVTPAANPQAHYGKMAELSAGKDTLTGHWELMGVKSETAFQTYPEGFPEGLLSALQSLSGRKIIGNKAASGTEILDELGRQHVDTGSLIVYTSADSVLQIAAHEDVVPLNELYRICEQARELTRQPQFFVARVIARPFIGEAGSWTRTANRRDYSVTPPARTVLDELASKKWDSIAIGKISDIFSGSGITEEIKTKSNRDGMSRLLDTMNRDFQGLCFLNLVDFDALYGHRRDPQGYAQALVEFDEALPDVISQLRGTDLLIITADHGNDPTHPGTDHTREYVPLLVYHKGITEGRNLGVLPSLAGVGATIAENFYCRLPRYGTSFLPQL
ncbi:phosphopentomutase [Paenibacillus senegalensis]|uniref:phosphopentomutase n=1 Tax=Paenibacillus senegalensis TaxID=1465766 RepID=UPI000289914A|nr:phosphopentomutase [Paenibacillus senegalensis]